MIEAAFACDRPASGENQP